MDTVENLHIKYIGAIQTVSSLESLEDLRVKALGKQGEISGLMKELGKMDPAERQEKGPLYNELRIKIQDAVKVRKAQLEEEALNQRLQSETIDISLPPRLDCEGHIHPLSQTLYEVTSIFSEMGFDIAEGPEIESDYYNFTALNIDESHPARQEHDTFYLPSTPEGETLVLRTHTSPVQIRTMMNQSPPFKVIAPGRTYRCDSDPTHTPNFHQIEGFIVDRNIHMGHLKGYLIAFWRKFFGVSDLPIRFRPSYFPFTEPSAEVDIGCHRTATELKIGAGDEWLEILGCGMINPKVLQNCGIDPEEYTGFAFGCGLERMAMLKYGIPDLRDFYESDPRWLRHYGFPLSQALSEGVNL